MVLVVPRADKTNTTQLGNNGRLLQASTCYSRKQPIFRFMNEQTPAKNNQLVLSALGKDQPGIIDEISNSVLNCGCTIIDSRMTVLGGDFALLLQVGGNWNSLAKLETQLKSLEERLELTIISRRSSVQGSRRDLLPYGVDVVALDQPGIVHNLARFFSKRHINIQEMVTTGYAAAHSGTQMFSVHMTVNVPANIHISTLREEFMEFCDELNLDALIEPLKN